jgi:hypothetical protein
VAVGRNIKGFKEFCNAKTGRIFTGDKKKIPGAGGYSDSEG